MSASQKLLYFTLLSLPGTFGQQYHWESNPCPTSCGVPPPVVKCVDSYGEAVADTLCDAYSKPRCQVTPPCAPSWHTSTIQCPENCGLLPTNATRTVKCKGIINDQEVDIAESYCYSSVKPSEIATCPATAPCAPFWEASDVKCPEYCGLPPNTVRRSVKCRGTINEKVVEIEESYCDASTKPSTSISCPTTAPCATAWHISDVQCPTYCGHMENTVPRVVQCKGIINHMEVVAEDSFCDLSVKPSSIVSCPATAPCAPYWQASDVQCPESCGLLESKQPRDVHCNGIVNGTVIVLDESFCAVYSKPSSAVTCPATAPCAPFWFTSDVECPTACGHPESNLPRTVACKGTIDNKEVVLADSECTLPKPATSVYCHATEECVNYAWQVSNEHCPTDCGRPSSTVTLTLSCVAKTASHPAERVVDSFCAQMEQPDTILKCEATLPCATASPDATESPNATAAPDATTAPDATAYPDATAAPNATAFPDTTAAPDATASPNTTAAPDTTSTPDSTTSPASYEWRVSNEECSTECGRLSSTLTLTATCFAITASQPEGTSVADSFCAELTKPSTTLTCAATSPCAPFWMAAPVNCPVTCGTPATSVTRLVECKGTVDGQVIVIDQSYCSESKPSTSVECPATPACAAYNWIVGDVQCPSECGQPQNEMTRPVMCIAGTTQGPTVNDSYCDANTKPSATLQCPETDSCVTPYTAQPTSRSGNTGIAIGVGVGVGVAVALFLLIGFLLRRRQSRQDKSRVNNREASEPLTPRPVEDVVA